MATAAPAAAPPPRPSLSRKKHLSIEIAPNMWVRYRGADETWECILNDFYRPVSCAGGCRDRHDATAPLLLFCVSDADFVICPSCRAVSSTLPSDDELLNDPVPADRGGDGGRSRSQRRRRSSSSSSRARRLSYSGGCGLGFTFEQLMSWQAEILGY